MIVPVSDLYNWGSLYEAVIGRFLNHRVPELDKHHRFPLLVRLRLDGLGS